jgi:hypothetical protein
MSPTNPQRHFGLLIWVALPVFLVLVLFGRFFGTPALVGERSGGSVITEAKELARSTIAISLQQ